MTLTAPEWAALPVVYTTRRTTRGWLDVVGTPALYSEGRDSLPSAPAEVAELEDALRSGRSEVPPRVGSSPTFGTIVAAFSIPSPLSECGEGVFAIRWEGAGHSSDLWA